MRINYGFVATSMALLFVLAPTGTSSVSAASAAEVPRFIRVIRRRSVNGTPLNPRSENTQGGSASVKSGVPQLGIPAATMERFSAGLASSIAKFSKDKDAGVEFPSQEEMSKAVSEALDKADFSDFTKVAQAIKDSIDALAERKLAEGKPDKNRGAKPATPSSAPQSNADKIAAALLETIKKFIDEKSTVGRLPTAAEVNKALTPAIQKIDFSNIKEGGEAIKSGLDHMTPPTKTQAAGQKA